MSNPNKDKLLTKSREDGAQNLSIDKIEINMCNSINRDKHIDFKCNCGNIHRKTVRQCLKSGLFCDNCTTKISKIKMSATKKKNNSGKIILEFIEKHGELYCYSKVEYENNDKEVIIICPLHGEFKQLPRTHKRGNGCRECAVENRGKQKKQKAAEKFIKESIEIHKNYYDYSKVDYQGAKTKVIIICPIHGEFEQEPSNHLYPYGCQKCGSESSSQIQSKTPIEYINEAKEKLGDKSDNFDYSKTEYFNSKKNVTIICKLHNADFTQSPNSHLKNHTGCEECKNIEKLEMGRSLKLTTDDFIKKAHLIHNNKYDYSSTIYYKTDEKIIIGCITCGNFKMSPSNHIHKTNPQGCPKCSLGKSEKLVFEYIVDKFKDNIIESNYRPDWLNNNNNSDLKLNKRKNLELDIFCKKLKFAIEYNGKQHYEYNTYFHNGNIENFHKQQERDKFKKKRCEEEGVYLIIIPYKYDCRNEEELYKHIDEKIITWKIDKNQEF